MKRKLLLFTLFLFYCVLNLFSEPYLIRKLDIEDFFKLPITSREKDNFLKLLKNNRLKRYLFLAGEEKDTFTKDLLFAYFIFNRIELGKLDDAVNYLKGVKNEELFKYFKFKILNSPARTISILENLKEKNFLSKSDGRNIFNWAFDLIKLKKYGDALRVINIGREFMEVDDTDYLLALIFQKKKLKKECREILLKHIGDISGKRWLSFFIIFNKVASLKELRSIFGREKVYFMAKTLYKSGYYTLSSRLLNLYEKKNDDELFLLGEIYFRLKPGKCLQYFSKIKDKKLFSLIDFYRCRTYLKLEKLDDACDIFEKKILPSNLDKEKKLLLLRGIAYKFELNGDIENEKRYYLLLISAFSEFEKPFCEANWKIAWIDFYNDKIAPGLSFLKKNLEVKKDSGYYLPSLFWYGYYNFFYGDKDRGMEILNSIGNFLPYTYYGYLSRYLMQKYKFKGSFREDLLTPLFAFAEEKRGEMFYNSLSEDEVKLVKYLLFFEDYEYLEKFLIKLSDRLGKGKYYNYFLYLLNKKMGRWNRVIYFFFKEYPKFYTYDLKKVDKNILRDVFPVPFKKILKRFSRKNHINLWLLYSLVRHESGFDPFAKSHSGAMGLMQLMPFTAKKYARRAGIRHFRKYKLYFPYVNIAIGTRYFRYLIKKTKEIVYAICSYNGGRLKVLNSVKLFEKKFSTAKIIEQIPMEETRGYVRSIFRNFIYYNYIYRNKILSSRFVIKYFLGENNFGGEDDFRNKKRRQK